MYNYERNASSKFELTFVNDDYIVLVLGDILDEYDDYRDPDVFTFEFERVDVSEVPEEFR